MAVTSYEIGTIVGDKYKLERFLGKGGMGAVYEAIHLAIGRPVAIKFLHPQLAGQPDVVTRFQQEARITGGLKHRNIVEVTDSGTADGAPFIVMEFLEGTDLAKLLASGKPLAVAQAVDIVVQACRGLEAAHKKEIVHRDLKPANLFLCKESDGSEVVKVLDFGVAKQPSTNQPTAPGVHVGTLGYMAPEQYSDPSNVGPEADIYALGVILYEALAGRRPYAGKTRDEIVHQTLNCEPESLGSLRLDLPRGLADAVARAMSRKPTNRPKAVDLRKRLEALQTEDRGAPTRRTVETSFPLAKAEGGTRGWASQVAVIAGAGLAMTAASLWLAFRDGTGHDVDRPNPAPRDAGAHGGSDSADTRAEMPDVLRTASPDLLPIRPQGQPGAAGAHATSGASRRLAAERPGGRPPGGRQRPPKQPKPDIDRLWNAAASPPESLPTAEPAELDSAPSAPPNGRNIEREFPRAPRPESAPRPEPARSSSPPPASGK